MKLNCTKKSKIIVRLFHKGLVGGRNAEVSLCQKVLHQWVVAKRPHILDVEGVEGMLTISKKASVQHVATEQQQR